MDKVVEQKLIEAAKEGVANAYSKNGSFDDSRIGAAVLTDKGNIYSSGQSYSDSGSLILHAEQGAVAHAAAHGEYAFVAIAVIGNKKAKEHNNNSLIYPCHICKQVLWERFVHFGVNTEIIIIDNDEVVERIMLKDIMNHAWPALI